MKNSKEFWNIDYWSNTIKNQKEDFLKDIWMEKYSDIIKNQENKTAIDLGCGIGQDTEYLKNQGFNVISCDISEVALKKLKERIPNSNTMQLDVTEKLPFEDNSIGIVNANLSLHYFDWKTTQNIFREINRVLAPNGLLIGRMNSDKNGTYTKESTEKIEENFYYDYGKYYRLWNQEQWNRITKDWDTIVLKENITIRREKTKALWEFILKKK